MIKSAREEGYPACSHPVKRRAVAPLKAGAQKKISLDSGVRRKDDEPYLLPR
jgi:hypothetical protein